MRKSEWIVIAIIALSFIVGICLYNQMPEMMASHWGVAGEVDGYMPKLWGLFLMPFVSVAMFLLFLILPKIDPLRRNIEKFRNYFDGFVVAIIAFMAYLYALILCWNMGYTFNMAVAIIPAFAVLFFFCGILMEKSKRNWFIGIKTPWTLSSDRVWDKTHKLGGLLFKICGVISLAGMLFIDYSILFILVPVIIVAAFLFVYSYAEYRNEKGRAKKGHKRR